MHGHVVVQGYTVMGATAPARHSAIDDTYVCRLTIYVTEENKRRRRRMARRDPNSNALNSPHEPAPISPVMTDMKHVAMSVAFAQACCQ